MRGVAQAQAAKDGDTEMPDLQLDALASLDRHASRYSAFSDDEDEDELHSLYLVRSLPCPSQFVPICAICAYLDGLECDNAAFACARMARVDCACGFALLHGLC